MIRPRAFGDPTMTPECPNPDCVDGWWWCDIGDGEYIKQRCSNPVHSASETRP